jgi:hypothetical protein
MQEFWFCEACKSMNRGDTDKCYRCRAPRARATMATVQERHLADVMLPGVDRLEQGAARATLTRHPYNVAWPLGYISAALMIPPVVFQFGFLLCEAAFLIALLVPDRLSLGANWWLTVQICLVGYGLSLAVMTVIHSAFLGLTNMNVPSLGGGQPRFGSPRASAWWIETALWASRAQLTIWVPLAIGLRTMAVLGPLGLLFACALMSISTWYLHNPFYSLRKPARLLEDLMRRLALRGSTDGGLVSMWSAAWSTARFIDVITPLVVLGGLIVMVIAAFVQMTRTASGSAPASELDFMTSVTTMSAVLFLMIMAEVVANVIALLLLARVTLSLSHSQRVRRTWVVASAGWSSGTVPTGHPAARPPSTPALPAVAPSPASDPPRWVRTQEELAGEYTSAPLPAEPPAEPPTDLPSEPLPPAESPKPVLRPSSGALPRYGLPPRPSAPTPPAPPQAPVDTTAPVEADWPEGI